MPDKKLSIYYSVFAFIVIAAFLGVVFHSFYTFDHDWDFSVLSPYIWMSSSEGLGEPGLMLQGLWMTVKLSVESIFFGTILGVIFGSFLLSSEKVSKLFAMIYVDVFRNTPALVQLLIGYYIIGHAFGLSEIVTAVLIMSLFCSSYVAEIFRGTIANFDKGQIEAAKALGMNIFQISYRVVAPQAIRRMLPPLVGQFVSLIKDSSLLSVIAIPELTKEAQNAITVSFRNFEIYLFLALLYLILNTILSTFGRYIEKKLSQSL
jgi:polar amino acid transport system permease protein